MSRTYHCPNCGTEGKKSVWRYSWTCAACGAGLRLRSGTPFWTTACLGILLGVFSPTAGAAMLIYVFISMIGLLFLQSTLVERQEVILDD